jgi:ribosome-associated heat shock protein Hsp15
MRIDKYLWCIRVFKTRSLAAEQCRLDKVQLNNEQVKASRDLKVGDVLQVRKGPVVFQWKVLSFPTSRVGAKLVPTYAEECTSSEEKQKLEMIRLQMTLERPRGLGRPTKKDRRSIDDFFDPDLFDETTED